MIINYCDKFDYNKSGTTNVVRLAEAKVDSRQK